MLKKSLCYIYFFCYFFSFSQNHLKEVKSFGKNPGNLSLYSFNATDKNFTRGKALVIALHGCAMTAQKLNDLTEWDSLAKKNDFVVFYPQQRIINNGSNCFNWFFEKDINRNGESLSLYSMMRYAIDSLRIDSTLIFFYGVSAGACMSEVMCANYPWLINGAAIYAGIPFKTATASEGYKLAGKAIYKSADERAATVANQLPFYRGKYPRIIILHGTKDVVTDFGYADQLVNQWKIIHAIKDSLPLSDKAFNGNGRIVRSVYKKAKEEVVIYYKMIDLAHKIAIHKGVGDDRGGKDKLFSEDIGFFSTYYIARDFGLIKHGKK